MNTYIIIKFLFFFLDSVCLLYYLNIVKKYGYYGFFLLSVITGTLCLYTSIHNLSLLYNDEIFCNRQVVFYEYLVYRLFTFVLEWSQYLLFLRFLFKNQNIKLLSSIIVSIVIIYNNYLYLEILEYELTYIVQNVSPLQIFV